MLHHQWLQIHTPPDAEPSPSQIDLLHCMVHLILQAIFQVHSKGIRSALGTLVLLITIISLPETDCLFLALMLKAQTFLVCNSTHQLFQSCSIYGYDGVPARRKSSWELEVGIKCWQCCASYKAGHRQGEMFHVRSAEIMGRDEDSRHLSLKCWNQPRA